MLDLGIKIIRIKSVNLELIFDYSSYFEYRNDRGLTSNFKIIHYF